VGDFGDRESPTLVGEDQGWVQLAVGRFHTCVRRADGAVYCTGENDDGRLGTGDFERRNVLTRVGGP
jgi:alpha-tubulin suppressor-like RCC1 family protein